MKKLLTLLCVFAALTINAQVDVIYSTEIKTSMAFSNDISLSQHEAKYEGTWIGGELIQYSDSTIIVTIENEYGDFTIIVHSDQYCNLRLDGKYIGDLVASDNYAINTRSLTFETDMFGYVTIVLCKI